MLTFKRTESIFKTYITSTSYKIPKISPKLVPQCRRCQRSIMCHMCTSDCIKPKPAQDKYANCDQAHYKGCEVANEIQLTQDKINKTNYHRYWELFKKTWMKLGQTNA